MRRLVIAALGLALAVGAIVGSIGMFTFGGPSRSAGAATLNRQAEITLFAVQNLSFDGNAGMEYRSTYVLTTIDTTKFPNGSTFTFNVGGQSANLGSHCFRLVEWLGGSEFTPVSGSEVCTAGDGNPFTLKSGPLTLPAGEHGYSFEWKNVSAGYDDGCGVGTIRVLADWTELSAVGGIAEAPSLAPTSGPGLGGATYPVLGAVAVLAITVVAATSVKKRSER